MEASDIQRVQDPTDLNRCQAVNKNGQCMNVAVPKGSNCMVHGGNKQIEAAERTSLENYQLTKFKIQTERLKNSDGIKSLRDEIAILRVVLETRLNGLESDTDLMLYSGPISDIILKIEKLVTSCHKLEGSMGMHLDKSAIIQFAGSVVQIISDEITDPDIVKRISDRLLEAMNNKQDDD